MALGHKRPNKRNHDHHRHGYLYACWWAFTGFEAFSQIGDGNTTFYYACTDGTDFETGIGTYTASGTTLARTTILQSSNSDSAVNWTSGTRTIFCTLPAQKMIFNDASGTAQNFTEQDPNALAFAIALG